MKFFSQASRQPFTGMNSRYTSIMDIDDTSMAQVSPLDGPYVTFIRRDKGASSLFLSFFPLYYRGIVHTSFIVNTLDPR